MRRREVVVPGLPTQADGGSLRDVAGARHRGHEGRLVDDQEVLVFVQDWDAVRDGLLRSGYAIEVHHRVGGEDAVEAKRGTILAHNFVGVESCLKSGLVVLGMTMALRGDEIVYEVPRGDWSVGHASVGRV